MSKSKPATRGQKAYESGIKLENRTARWLTSQFKYNCKKRDFARGKISKRPYEVDIHGIKEGLFKRFSRTHLWVECKAYKVKRTNVTKLVESARDVEDAKDADIEKWSANLLMLVSNKGFDVDAIGMANKYKIYCVKAGKSFEFVSKRNRDHFKDGEESEF